MKDAEFPKVTPLCSFQASGGYPSSSGSGQGYSGNPPPVMMPGGYPVSYDERVIFIKKVFSDSFS